MLNINSNFYNCFETVGPWGGRVQVQTEELVFPTNTQLLHQHGTRNTSRATSTNTTMSTITNTNTQLLC